LASSNDGFVQCEGDKRSEFVAFGPALQGSQAGCRVGAPGVLDEGVTFGDLKALRSVIFNRREYGAVAPRDVDFFYTWLLAVSKNRLVNMTTHQYRAVYKKLLI